LDGTYTSLAVVDQVEFVQDDDFQACYGVIGNGCVYKSVGL